MNDKELQNVIKDSIENDLPNLLISAGDYHLLKGRLDTLKLKLFLYVDTSGEIADHNYNEIKIFIYKILNLKNIKLKLKYFDLTIKLLEKVEIGKAESYFNKEFFGALDLLKKFVTEEKYIPNEADLKYISNLDHGNNESDIRKSFYGIIHELDKKLLFQDLLKQLLEIIKNKNDLPLILFSIIFISKCLDDAQMDASDLYQAIHIMYSALTEYNTQFKRNTILNRILGNNLIDLKKFKETLREKISRSITDNLVNQSSQKQKSTVQVALILKELDFGTFFTTDINSKKIKRILDDAKVNYNDTFKRKASADNFSLKFFKEGYEKLSNKAKEVITKVKHIAAADIVDTRTHQLSTLKHEEIDQIDLNNLLTQAKAKLSSIKEKLEIWSPIINYPIKSHIKQQNQIDTGQINITEVIADFDVSINKKYNSLSLQILDEFEKTNTNIKEKDYWLAESENNKISLAYKIFHRGYFNIDFSREKLKAKVGDPPSFEKINDFILKQSFWSLLFTYRIVRWPWLKNNLADTWAQQLCLPDVITQTEELKEKLSTNNNEGLVEKIIVLLNAFSPYKKSETVVEILKGVEEYIVAQLNQLEILESKINDCLNEKINLAKTPGNRYLASFFAASDGLSQPATVGFSQSISASILAN